MTRRDFAASVIGLILSLCAITAQAQPVGLDTFGLTGSPVRLREVQQVVQPCIMPRPIMLFAPDRVSDLISAAASTYVRASTAVRPDGVLLPANYAPYGRSGYALLEGSATNKVICAKSNPQDLTNISKSGDAAAVLSVVNDAAALAAAGLSAFGPNVYKLDNRLGTTNAYAVCAGVTGNANPHSLSVYARGSGNIGITWARSSANTITWTGTDGYLRKKIENSVSGYDPASIDLLTIKAFLGSIVYFTLPQLEEGPVCTSPIPGGTGAITRASAGADTSGNGLQLQLSPAMIASLSAGGAGTICQWLDIPWASSVVPNSTLIPIETPGNTSGSFVYLSKDSGGNYTLNLSDGINVATVAAPSTAGRVVAIPQFSAALGRMRVGLWNPVTKTLTWSSTTLAGGVAYRGFSPIHSSNKLRWCYALGKLPIWIGPCAWFDSILTDDQIRWMIGELDTASIDSPDEWRMAA